MGRLAANYSVLKTQLGFNNPSFETNRFSLRREMLRFGDDDEAPPSGSAAYHRVDDCGGQPEFRRYARLFAPESLGPAGVVIPFSTTVTFGSTSASRWAAATALTTPLTATAIRGVGSGSEHAGPPPSNTPRVTSSRGCRRAAVA